MNEGVDKIHVLENYRKNVPNFMYSLFYKNKLYKDH